MKLAFNCLYSGLGNGGGSKTTIMCAKVLEELGHKCDIIATVDNFDWFDHKPVINHIPDDLDVIIATACTTVLSTLQSNVPKKAYYIRGFENWIMNEKKLVADYKSGLFNITNSYGLQRKLKKFGVKSVVIHQGIDFEQWDDRKLRPKNKIRIGCLYQKKDTKRWVDFVELAGILGSKNYEYVGFGTELRKDSFLDYFICSPTHDQLVDLYSSCDIFFCPTELEGLFNVAMEAALCGCLIVCSDASLNGMVYDYAFDDDMSTAMIYKARDIKTAAVKIKDPDYGAVDRMQFYIKNFIGSRKTNMKKFIKYMEET
jgi:glycosyltransferase involved in cell wall biosynthesis